MYAYPKTGQLKINLENELQLYHEDWDNEKRDYQNPIGKFKER